MSGYLQAASSPFISSVRTTAPSPTAVAMSQAIPSTGTSQIYGTTHSTSYGGNYGSSTTTNAQMQSTVQSERIISSNVVGEQQLSSVPEDSVQYVEVPVVEERVRYVNKKEYVEVEKKVPKYEYEWVERVVEVPHIQTVEKYVEVPQIQEVVRHVPRREVIDVPREVVRHVPKIETKIVEKVVQVPGEVIEVEKKYTVEKKVVVPRYNDRDVPTVVAQSVYPCITESETDFVDVDLKEYNPYLVKVDVFVPKPIQRNLIAADRTDEHRIVDVPVEQFNALVKQLNGRVDQKYLENLLVKDRNGGIPIAPMGPGTAIVAPVPNAEIQGEHAEGQMHYFMTNNITYSTGPITTTTTSGATRFVTAPSSSITGSYTPVTTTSMSATNRGIPSTSVTHLGGYTTTSGQSGYTTNYSNAGFSSKVGMVYYGGSSLPMRSSFTQQGGLTTSSRA